MKKEEFEFGPLRMLLPSEEVARRLADAVRTGKFKVGDRFPSERRLAEQLGVSRPTVREAERILIEMGIISIKAGVNGGAFVTSENVPFDFLIPQTMRPGEMYEILELRRLILPWVVQQAYSNAEDDDFDRMRSAIDFGREQLKRVRSHTITQDDIRLVITASVRFDLAIAKATGNELVTRLMDMLLRWVEPLRIMLLKGRKSDLEKVIDWAEQTLVALESGDRARLLSVIDRRLAVLEKAVEKQSGRVSRERRRAT